MPKDEFKRNQFDCNCPGPGVGGYKCPNCQFSRKERIKTKRLARRRMKQAIREMKI